jgi:hypothetical protein
MFISMTLTSRVFLGLLAKEDLLDLEVIKETGVTLVHQDLKAFRDQKVSNKFSCRMPSSGMLHRVALVRTDVSEELRASLTRVTRIGELGTILALTSNRRMSVRRLIVTASVFPSSPILVTLIMEAQHPRRHHSA